MGFINYFNLLILVAGITPFSVQAQNARPCRQATIQTFNGEDVPQNVKLDVLMVIDNSGSMASHHEKLRSGTRAFLNQLVQQKADFNIAIVTSSFYQDNSKPIKSGLGGYRLNAKNYQENPTRFSDEITSLIENVGTRGTNQERLLDSAKKYAEQYFNSDNKNFLRADAQLVLFFLSDLDEEDASDVDDFLASISRHRTKEGIYLSGLLKKTQTESDQLWAPYLKFQSLIQDHGVPGSFGEITSPTFDENLQYTAKNAAQSVARRLTIRLDHKPLRPEFTFSIKDVREKVDELAYDAQSNTVSFSKAFAETLEIKVEYPTACPNSAKKKEQFQGRNSSNSLNGDPIEQFIQNIRIQMAKDIKGFEQESTPVSLEDFVRLKNKEKDISHEYLKKDKEFAIRVENWEKQNRQIKFEIAHNVSSPSSQFIEFYKKLRERKKILFIVDSSGSMGDQFGELGRQLGALLKSFPADVEFNAVTESEGMVQALFEGPTLNTDQAQYRVRKFISGFYGAGGSSVTWALRTHAASYDAVFILSDSDLTDCPHLENTAKTKKIPIFSVIFDQSDRYFTEDVSLAVTSSEMDLKLESATYALALEHKKIPIETLQSIYQSRKILCHQQGINPNYDLKLKSLKYAIEFDKKALRQKINSIKTVLQKPIQPVTGMGDQNFCMANASQLSGGAYIKVSASTPKFFEYKEIASDKEEVQRKKIYKRIQELIQSRENEMKKILELTR